MSNFDEDFTELYAYFSKEISSINSKLDNFVTKQEFNKLFNTLDGVLKHHETYYQEILGLVHSQEVHECWIGQLASNTKTKLSPKII
ncbi:MAG TPA: hypothetical protein VIH90_04050 [Candidatus Saccharimonadales bacterium]